MKQLFILTILSLFTAISFGNTLQDSIAELELSNKLDVLNKIAYLSFPEKAESFAMSHNIMSAPTSGDQETRIVFDIDNMRLVLFAQELFLTGTEDLLDDLNIMYSDKNLAKYGYANKIIKEDGNFKAILSTPSNYDEDKDAILINSLIVQNIDNTIFRIDAYINPAGFKSELKAYIALSERIFETIEQGERMINLKKKTKKFEVLGAGHRMIFDLPEKHVMTVDNGPDFDVYKIQNVKPFTSSSYSQLMVYTGNHPSWFYRSLGFTKDQAIEKDGVFLKKKTKWMYFEDKENGVYLLEFQYNASRISEGLIIHIAIVAKDASDIDQYMEIVEGLKLEK